MYALWEDASITSNDACQASCFLVSSPDLLPSLLCYTTLDETLSNSLGDSDTDLRVRQSIEVKDSLVVIPPVTNAAVSVSATDSGLLARHKVLFTELQLGITAIAGT